MFTAVDTTGENIGRRVDDAGRLRAVHREFTSSRSTTVFHPHPAAPSVLGCMLLSPESTDVTTTDDGLSFIMVKNQNTHRARSVGKVSRPVATSVEISTESRECA
jgi:hypothetical protein